MDYNELIKFCSDVKLEVSRTQIQSAEEATRQQRNSKLWYTFRAGRITASNMRAVCHTSETEPAKSLIKRVCYPDAVKFSCAATQWGCDQEKVAVEMFTREMSKTHTNFTVYPCGLFICQDLPYIAASPDGIASCDCCGRACVEVKCPYSARHGKIDSSIPCLKETDGSLKLDKKHEYFYQVQTQMGATDLEFAYFVVWTTRDIHIETVYFEDEFWTSVCAKSKTFFQNAVLPELTGKFYSRLPIQPPQDRVIRDIPINTMDHSWQKDTWCYCRKGESGMMIACENENCKIVWFHFTCLKINKTPTGKWYCPECRN